MDVDTDDDGDCLDFDDTQSNPEGGAERYFYLQDANWNVIALRRGSDIVERYEYDPYGNVRIFAGYNPLEGHEDLTVIGDSIVDNPILFAGYFHDNETGLYHVRHRMYSPTLQRWLQRDPAGYVDGMNLYAYARCQPTAATDSSGLAPEACCKYQVSTYVWAPATPYDMYDTPTLPVVRFLEQRTIPCPSLLTPEQCCRCYDYGKERRITHHSAHRGRCCTCTIEERQDRDYSWGDSIIDSIISYFAGHTVILIECDNGYRAALDWYGGLAQIEENRIQFPEYLKNYEVKLRKAHIDCACVGKIKARARTWDGLRWWPLVRDCHRFTDDLFRYAMRECYRRYE